MNAAIERETIKRLTLIGLRVVYNIVGDLRANMTKPSDGTEEAIDDLLDVIDDARDEQ